MEVTVLPLESAQLICTECKKTLPKPILLAERTETKTIIRLQLPHDDKPFEVKLPLKTELDRSVLTVPVRWNPH